MDVGKWENYAKTLEGRGLTGASQAVKKLIAVKQKYATIEPNKVQTLEDASGMATSLGNEKLLQPIYSEREKQLTAYTDEEKINKDKVLQKYELGTKAAGEYATSAGREYFLNASNTMGIPSYRSGILQKQGTELYSRLWANDRTVSTEERKQGEQYLIGENTKLSKFEKTLGMDTSDKDIGKKLQNVYTAATGTGKEQEAALAQAIKDFPEQLAQLVTLIAEAQTGKNVDITKNSNINVEINKAKEEGAEGKGIVTLEEFNAIIVELRNRLIETEKRTGVSAKPPQTTNP